MPLHTLFVVNTEGPELVLGLVTPIGTNTVAPAEAVVGALSDYSYESMVIKPVSYTHLTLPTIYSV